MLNNLKKILESEKKDPSILDIVIYGSITREETKPNDIDIIIIFTEGTLKERLEKTQNIKKKINKTQIPIDIKQMLIKDFFKPEFLARTGILLEGISVFKNKNFSETLGFKPKTIIKYTTKQLTHTEKIKLNYILSGRNKQKGMLKITESTRIANETIITPINKVLIIEKILSNFKIKYEKTNILEET